MKEIKVYSLFGNHPVFREIIDFPPDNVSYLVSKQSVVRHNKPSDILKKKIYETLVSTMQIPRVAFLDTGDADIIHSTRGIMILNKKPWVIDYEHMGCSAGKNIYKSNYKMSVKKFFFSKYCKKILPWTNAAKESIINYIVDSRLDHKLEVVYPAMHAMKFKKKESNKINFLFVGNRFFMKGCKEVLEAFEILNKKYDIELTVICNVPKEFKDKYSHMKNVNFKYPKIPREKLLEIYYPKADIFLFPTYKDTFGMVLLEAMASGLPIITTNIFANPEIIENGKNGFLVEPGFWSAVVTTFDRNFYKKDFTSNKPRVVKQIVEKASILIEDSSLRKKMGKYGRKQIEKGKFSIKERNKKLRRIYEESIKV